VTHIAPDYAPTIAHVPRRDEVLAPRSAGATSGG
jgi:hypothetical protein